MCVCSYIHGITALRIPVFMCAHIYVTALRIAVFMCAHIYAKMKDCLYIFVQMRVRDVSSDLIIECFYVCVCVCVRACVDTHVC